MFELLTDRARQVVVLAQEEARLLDHDHIGTEHLLLAIVRDSEEPGGAVPALAALPGVGLAAARARVGEIAGPGTGGAASGRVPFTPRAKKVLELSLREARLLGHGFIDVAHVLLGIVREGGGLGARVLADLGADLPAVRDAAVASLADARGERRPPGPAKWPPGPEGVAAGGAVRGPALRAGRAEVEPRLDAVDHRLAALDQRLGDFDRRLGAIEARLGAVEGLLRRLVDREDAREDAREGDHEEACEDGRDDQA